MTETRKLLSLFTGITFIAFLAFQTVSMTNVSASDVCPGGDNSWSNNWYKDEHSSFGVTASGYVIDQICVKGGQNMVTFNSNGSNGCWSVSGIGTQTGSAVKVGQGSSCKDISHASFHRVVVASPTPSTAPTAIPTAIPTTVPTAVPTSVPTTAPTAIPTSIPSVTPIVTVAVDPSVSPEPTITATPTVTPTDTPSSSTNNNSSSNNSSSNNEVKVAGISALASTGGIIDSLMNSVFVSGLLTFAFGLKRHGKKS